MKKSKTGAIQYEGAGDIPLMPVSRGDMTFNPTGTWKYIEPYYQDRTPPCNADCPTGQDVVIQLALCAEGRFAEALAILRMANPFPAVTGRVCPHPCESRCNRESLGGVLSIRAIERFLGDYGIDAKLRYRPEEKRKERVAVVGSGPAGLACAFYLGLRGYAVTVYEALGAIGGLLATGIPEFRLPRKILDDELKIFEGLPVEFRTGRRLGTNLSLDDLKKFQASCIAVGRYNSPRLGVEGEEIPGVFSGIEVLRKIKLGEPISIGKRVLVIGGGNTALDCARSLSRLNHNVRVLYRRSAAEMPAFPDDIEEAKEEGIAIEYLAAPSRIISREGKMTGVECLRMKLGEPDASGRRRPLPQKGSEFTIEADALLTALGETVDLLSLATLPGIGERGISVDEHSMSHAAGIFAAGDCAGGAGTVSDAIGRGRRAAEAIDARLSGRPREIRPLTQQRGATSEVIDTAKLNLAYIPQAPGIDEERVPAETRLIDFREVNKGLTKSRVMREAARCISCGTCTHCDNCRVFCPDVAISRGLGGSGFIIDYGHCKGCGICVRECPRSAMGMRNIGGENHQ